MRQIYKEEHFSIEMSNKIVKSYKFRLYPSKKEEIKLMETLDLCRQTYNFLLQELNDQEVIDKSQIQGIIPDLKICEPKFNKLYSKVMQYECYRLFSNLRALSKSKELEKAYLAYDRNLLVADVRRKESRKPGDSKARRKRQKSYR